VPEHLRSDNGPEFVAKDLRQWLINAGAKTLYIELVGLVVSLFPSRKCEAQPTSVDSLNLKFVAIGWMSTPAKLP
jgi:hypothetical protein